MEQGIRGSIPLAIVTPQRKLQTLVRFFFSVLQKRFTCPIAGAEEAAAAERREALKARKAERARRARENSNDEDENVQGDESDAVAPTTVRPLVTSDYYL